VRRNRVASRPGILAHYKKARLRLPLFLNVARLTCKALS
jgi:hypothetical protein